MDPRQLAVVPDPELEACFAMADAGALSCGCFAGNCECLAGNCAGQGLARELHAQTHIQREA